MYNILLTDDEQIMIDSISMILNKNFSEQVKIFTANSGTKAIEEVRTKNIDIIFMDIRMPGISGIEAISLIKQLNPNIVIIVLSAYDKFQYAQQALNLGAFKYLTKPVKPAKTSAKPKTVSKVSKSDTLTVAPNKTLLPLNVLVSMT